MTPLVSVMIPTRKRVRRLTATLTQLAKTALESPPYEVIVMIDEDDHETMGMRHWLETSFDNLRAVPTKPMGYKALDTYYYKTMEEMAAGDFVWIAGDDMLVTGDWLGELSRVPLHGYIVQPEFSKLRESVYERAEAQAFPIFPRFCWKEYVDNFPMPFDLRGHELLLRNGWKTWFLEGVTMHHDRPDEAEIYLNDPTRRGPGVGCS